VKTLAGEHFITLFLCVCVIGSGGGGGGGGSSSSISSSNESVFCLHRMFISVSQK